MRCSSRRPDPGSLRRQSAARCGHLSPDRRPVEAGTRHRADVVREARDSGLGRVLDDDEIEPAVDAAMGVRSTYPIVQRSDQRTVQPGADGPSRPDPGLSLWRRERAPEPHMRRKEFLMTTKVERAE